MGNASSTKQKIHNIIATNAEAGADAETEALCVNDPVITTDHMINCSILVQQTCKSMSNASMDIIIAALAKAEVTQEVKQAVDGLATGANVDVSDQDLKNEVINTLNSKCRALAQTKAIQRPVFNFGYVDCTKMTNPMLEVSQYGDAGADCVVSTLVDAAVDATAKSKKDQLVEGFDPLSFLKSDNMLMMIGAIAGLGILATMMGNGKMKGQGGMMRKGRMMGQGAAARASPPPPRPAVDALGS